MASASVGKEHRLLNKEDYEQSLATNAQGVCYNGDSYSDITSITFYKDMANSQLNISAILYTNLFIQFQY